MFHIRFQVFFIHAAFFFMVVSRVQDHWSVGADRDVTDLLTPPNCRHHSLGQSKGTRMAMFALYLSEHSRAGCRQAVAPAARGQGAHLDPTGRQREPWGGQCQCGILAWPWNPG